MWHFLLFALKTVTYSLSSSCVVIRSRMAQTIILLTLKINAPLFFFVRRRGKEPEPEPLEWGVERELLYRPL